MESIRKHIKLYILIFVELTALVALGLVSSRHTEDIVFTPSDFVDNAEDRDNVSVGEAELRFISKPEAAIYDDEGKLMGEDLMSGKFAIASGCYRISVDYETDFGDSYVELYSQSHVSETVSSRVELTTDRRVAEGRIIVPVGRSMHDIQMSIHYSGEGTLAVHGIRLTEERVYTWVPIAGYFLLFVCMDVFLYLMYALSGHKAREYLRTHYEILAVAAVTVLASLPAFADFLYAGHDLEFHLARIIAVSREITYGQFPVRMLTDMLRGYGYPTSTYYCDLFLFPFALLYSAGLPLRMCWQTYIIMINLSTAVVSYICFQNISKNRDIGIVGSTIYTLSAYRIVDVHLRSAMGEFTAMSFIPLVILGIWRIYYDEKEDIIGWGCLGVGMTGISLSHLLSLEMISLFLLLFCIFEYRRTVRRKVLLSVVKAALMTVLLSCWFIIPMLLSMSGIELSMYEHQQYIQAEGAYPSQVFNPFMRGTGLSTTRTPREMPLSIGGGMIVALGMLIWWMMRKDNAGSRKKTRTVFVMTVISLLFSMYFFPWDSIAGVMEGRIDAISRLARMVQYPWRYLEITTALLTVTAVVILSEMTEDKSTWMICTALLLLGTVISLGVFYDPFINESKTTKADNEYYIDDKIGGEEYLPAGSGPLWELPLQTEVPGSSSVQVTDYKVRGGERHLTVSNPGIEASVLIPVFCYRGYRAEDSLSGKTIAVSQGDKGRISLLIPSQYSGTIRVYYREPAVWRIFELISCVSFGFYLALWIRSRG